MALTSCNTMFASAIAANWMDLPVPTITPTSAMSHPRDSAAPSYSQPDVVRLVRNRVLRLELVVATAIVGFGCFAWRTTSWENAFQQKTLDRNQSLRTLTAAGRAPAGAGSSSAVGTNAGAAAGVAVCRPTAPRTGCARAAPSTPPSAATPTTPPATPPECPPCRRRRRRCRRRWPPSSRCRRRSGSRPRPPPGSHAGAAARRAAPPAPSGKRSP